jgi:S1-C subfamily serine protease
MRRNAIALLILTLAPCVHAAQIAPRELPERCTVAITAKEGNRSYFGTGSVVSPLGYVLTSTTVVPPKAKEISIVSPEHFKLKGTLLKADEKTELSLIRVEPPDGEPLPAFVIRDSDTVRLGEVVMTVSNSFQLARSAGELSVSVGLHSGRYKLTRKIALQPVYIGEVLETTAATNPGSDGGPLLDGSGRLIGVLTLNVSNARWLGAAVPINVMLPHLRTAITEDLEKRKIKPANDPLPVVKKPGEPLYPAWEARAARFRDAAARVAESVVAIKVDRTKDDPRFKRRRRVGRTGRARLLGEILKRPKDATVTGVVVGADGWVATSYFNVAGKLKSVHVVMPDGRELPAKVFGWDQERDLALLKVEAAGLPAIEFRPDARVGDDVCVLGRSPTADSLTLTSGIISAVGRRENAMLQFDAKCNVGNAGGPLVGLDGRCRGIVGHVTTNSRHGQNSGIAFATWASVLPDALELLKAGKKIRRRPRAVLGITAAPGAVDLQGVLVARVQKGSGADKAGIQKNDSILEINEEKMEGVAQLVKTIRAMKPGDKVKLKVRRRARVMELEAVLGERD